MVESGYKGEEMFKEFREFAIRGNMIDLAVGIIIGAAFTALVNSAVNDLIMPLIGYVTGGLDFSSFFIVLNGKSYPSAVAAKAAGAPAIYYGLFINAVIIFLITAIVVFIIVRAVNDMRRREEGAPKEGPSTKDCPLCHTSIPIKAIRCPNCTSDLTKMPEGITS